MGITINCDIGESYGLYSFGNDEKIMPHINIANVACGVHASDPTVMHKTVLLAKDYGVKIGAHPSLPDRQGFGRREMKMEREELRDLRERDEHLARRPHAHEQQRVVPVHHRVDDRNARQSRLFVILKENRHHLHHRSTSLSKVDVALVEVIDLDNEIFDSRRIRLQMRVDVELAFEVLSIL